MKQRVLIVANVVVGVIIICLSVIGFLTSHALSESAVLYLGIGVSFCIVPYGLRIRSRVLVSLISIPLILMLGAVSFMLLFAPFAWGDSNIQTVYLLQSISLFLGALQIGGLIDVFSAPQEYGEKKEC